MLTFDIIIPCEGRPILVHKLLRSLLVAQNNYGGESSVIIIDSTTGKDERRIQESCKIFGTRYIRGPVNVREKRNIGVFLAVHDLLLFVDSDVEVPPDLLAQHAKGYREGIGGVLGIVMFKGPLTPIWPVIGASRYVGCFSFASRMPYTPWGPCANISYRRELICKLGGFHTGFPFRLGADDVDIGLRVNEAGYRILCEPRAIVFHSRSTWGGLIVVAKRGFRWGRMHVHLSQRHWKKTCLEWLRPELVWLLMTLLSVMISPFSILRHLSCLSAAVFYWLLMAVLERKGALADLMWPERALTQALNSVYEFGLIFESIRVGNFPMLFRKIVYSPGQVINEYSTKVREQFALLGSILAYALLFG
jgi:cellulose synthase/poly-beta-1,6-N-acetylglucosamine synthase-like glycosyltransferase